MVARISFRSAFQGFWTYFNAILAAIPSIVVASLLLSGSHATSVENAAQGLFSLLTLRVVVVLVALVIAAGLFRDDIERDTLTYLSTRSVTRPDVVFGKYLGAVGAALIFLLPAGIVPLLVAGLGGAPPPPTSVTGSILAITLLATLSYGAFFLFLGLVSRNALLIGLLYGILWEELVLLLPGHFPKLTQLYYFLTIANGEVTSGPLSGGLTALSPAEAAVVPIGIAVAFVGLTAALFRFVETAPQRTSA